MRPSWPACVRPLPEQDQRLHGPVHRAHPVPRFQSAPSPCRAAEASRRPFQQYQEHPAHLDGNTERCLRLRPQDPQGGQPCLLRPSPSWPCAGPGSAQAICSSQPALLRDFHGTARRALKEAGPRQRRESTARLPRAGKASARRASRRLPRQPEPFPLPERSPQTCLPEWLRIREARVRARPTGTRPFVWCALLRICAGASPERKGFCRRPRVPGKGT